MESCGGRGTQAREDEQRREERGEQQAPTPQGPMVLPPPPPPVDYGVFMQGLAQAPAPVPQEHGHGGSSIMERFKRMAPPSFKRESQPLLAESWMREVEKIFRAIRCAEEDKVSLATYMLQSVFPTFLDPTHPSPVLPLHFQGWPEVVGFHFLSRRVSRARSSSRDRLGGRIR
ncbi:hypothetical protein Taro_048169 [Colocasia esculenta]|uniref:Uncharacterized protein n=1 Tax=Colocasia esculenta TaxID=4460 RepID=A0A843WXR4_COLES|nr:hypothetical protein [Colocasia esculenta]